MQEFLFTCKALPEKEHFVSKKKLLFVTILGNILNGCSWISKNAALYSLREPR